VVHHGALEGLDAVERGDIVAELGARGLWRTCEEAEERRSKLVKNRAESTTRQEEKGLMVKSFTMEPLRDWMPLNVGTS